MNSNLITKVKYYLPNHLIHANSYVCPSQQLTVTKDKKTQNEHTQSEEKSSPCMVCHKNPIPRNSPKYCCEIRPLTVDTTQSRNVRGGRRVLVVRHM